MEDNMEFVKLFTPITINGLEIKNRIVMPAMGLHYTHDYTFNDRYKAFYRERAKGGVGLMTIGPVAIDRAGSFPMTPGIFDDRNLDSFRTFLAALHAETDARISMQLFHMGGELGPSPVPNRMTGQTPKEMTKEDVEETKRAFAQGAARAREVGFDFVEIIACTGYLISRFLSPLTNKRVDEYGGSLDNRMRFGLEVIDAVRKAVGDDFPLGIRIAGNDFMEGGNTNVEAAQFAAAAEQAGVDAINVTGGWHDTYVPQLTTGVPPGAFVYLARGIKEKVGLPVFASNRLGDPAVAERALRSGACDMICWGRPLITDPDLPTKVKQGRLDEIVRCVACNQGCFDVLFTLAPAGCILNPRAGHEDEFVISRTDSPKNIAVAGGGPAGMEFAIVAAQRGHQVTLYEETERLGGQLNLAKAVPGKKELDNIVTDMTRRLARHGVALKTNTPLTPAILKQLHPDVLVVATGARPQRAAVPGIDRPHVVNAWDILSEHCADVGKRVVIVGGSATGCEAALYIAAMNAPDPETCTFLMYHHAESFQFLKDLLHNSGRSIAVIDMLDRMATNVGPTSRWPLMKSLKLMGVNLHPKTRLLEITEDSVHVETEGRSWSIPADTVVLAMGVTPVTDLTQQVYPGGPDVVILGDAKAPRRITEAVREGFEAAMRI
jgi:2,4-dienoyl-CoA reductase (NADPH2)